MNAVSFTTKTGKTLSLRSLHPEDKEAMQGFYDGLSTRTLDIYYQSDTERDFETAWQNLFNDGVCGKNVQQYIVFDGTKIVGWRKSHKLSKNNEISELYGTVYETCCLVDDSYQGSGIGSALLSATISHAENSWGGAKLYARTKPENLRAQKLLEKFRFKREKLFPPEIFIYFRKL